MLPVAGMRWLIALVLMSGVAVANPTVTVRSAIDNSSATSHDKKLEGLMRRTIERIVARAPIKLPGNRHVDASLESLTTESSGNTLIVRSSIRVIVTDDAGRITSVLGSSAKVASATRRSRLPQMREEAVVNALEAGYRQVKDRLHGK